MQASAAIHEVYDKRSRFFAEPTEGFALEWDYYLQKFQETIDASNGFHTVSHSIEVPVALWNERGVKWDSDDLISYGWDIQGRFTKISINTRD